MYKGRRFMVRMWRKGDCYDGVLRGPDHPEARSAYPIATDGMRYVSPLRFAMGILFGTHLTVSPGLRAATESAIRRWDNEQTEFALRRAKFLPMNPASPSLDRLTVSWESHVVTFDLFRVRAGYEGSVWTTHPSLGWDTTQHRSIPVVGRLVGYVVWSRDVIVTDTVGLPTELRALATETFVAWRKRWFP